MDTSGIITIILGAVFLIFVGVCWYFKKDYIKYHENFAPVVSALYTCVKAVGGLVPDNSIIKILTTVMQVTVEATTKAEELWLDSMLDKEKRNTYAKQYIERVLKYAGIEITSNIEAIIDGAISFTCCLLPHGKSPKKESTKEEA